MVLHYWQSGLAEDAFVEGIIQERLYVWTNLVVIWNPLDIWDQHLTVYTRPLLRCKWFQTGWWSFTLNGGQLKTSIDQVINSDSMCTLYNYTVYSNDASTSYPIYCRWCFSLSQWRSATHWDEGVHWPADQLRGVPMTSIVIVRASSAKVCAIYVSDICHYFYATDFGACKFCDKE